MDTLPNDIDNDNGINAETQRLTNNDTESRHQKPSPSHRDRIHMNPPKGAQGRKLHQLFKEAKKVPGNRVYIGTEHAPNLSQSLKWKVRASESQESETSFQHEEGGSAARKTVKISSAQTRTSPELPSTSNMFASLQNLGQHMAFEDDTRVPPGPRSSTHMAAGPAAGQHYTPRGGRGQSNAGASGAKSAPPPSSH